MPVWKLGCKLLKTVQIKSRNFLLLVLLPHCLSSCILVCHHQIFLNTVEGNEVETSPVTPKVRIQASQTTYVQVVKSTQTTFLSQGKRTEIKVKYSPWGEQCPLRAGEKKNEKDKCFNSEWSLVLIGLKHKSCDATKVKHNKSFLTGRTGQC